MMSEFKIEGLFPCPVYVTQRDSNLNSTEGKEIEDIFEEGMYTNQSNSTSNNSYIFDTRLNKLKRFCEEHIKSYVKEIINPKEELDFYITQSWLNVNRPGEQHHTHSHPNSIISGVFYVQTVENDSIYFYDILALVKRGIEYRIKEDNIWNSTSCFLPVEKNKLVLFPSWMGHSVVPNEKATKNRISLAFNTFVKGILGKKEAVSELIL